MRISDWSSDVCSSDLGQFRTVDTGIGAVEQRHRHIHDRKTERSLRHRVANTLLDGRNPLLGHCAAGDLLVKAKAFAERERLQLDHHIAELPMRSEEHTSELQSLMRISYAVFCLKKKKILTIHSSTRHIHQSHIHNSSLHTT